MTDAGATSARRVGLDVLTSVGRGGPTLGQRLAQPDVEALPPRERAFLHELVLGTLRTRGALDHALAPLLDRPMGRLDPRTRAILRMGAHQLLHLRVPARAAVNESVELAGGVEPRAKGLVNAVLRKLSVGGPPPFPDPVEQPLAWLTTEGSLTPWLAQRWILRLGPKRAVERARAFLVPPPLVFRLNPRRGDASERVAAAGAEPRALPVPGALAGRRGSLQALAAEGVVYVQDQGAQLAAHLAAVPGTLLDACAAPGGKATLLADLVGNLGWVVAAEASLWRLESLVRLAARWGAPNLRFVAADARRLPFRHGFEGVLLDAPCSGLGTLGRHPDLRWRSQPEDLQRHSRRQRDLLEALSPFVNEGGRLVYATCSSEPEENEDVVRSFLGEHPGFALASLPRWAKVFAEDGFAHTTPERDGGDAFFCAVLEHV